MNMIIVVEGGWGGGAKGIIFSLKERVLSQILPFNDHASTSLLLLRVRVVSFLEIVQR